VDSAPTFPEVLRNVEIWLNERDLLSSNKRKCGFATDGYEKKHISLLFCDFSFLVHGILQNFFECNVALILFHILDGLKNGLIFEKNSQVFIPYNDVV
jgi:hypothetical protein